MEWINPIAMIIICVVMPYFVNLCKKSQWTANVKRWVALGISVIVGIAAGVIFGAPTPQTFVAWCFAVIGGSQTAYAAFKSIGVTNTWLDALEGIGSEGEKTE